jgi:hypothetical protein
MCGRIIAVAVVLVVWAQIVVFAGDRAGLLSRQNGWQ